MFLLSVKYGMTALGFAHTIKEALIKLQPVGFFAEKLLFEKTDFFKLSRLDFISIFLTEIKINFCVEIEIR